ncbi:MAG: hypothetical protein ACI85U_003666 [Candidatus Promineifilaceae bacterium]|jgi:hypothetical protein
MTNWKNKLVYPEYGSGQSHGTTIANIAPTMAALLDRPFVGLPPLPEACYRPLQAAGPVERVVFILLDAMGQNLIDDHPQIQEMGKRAVVKETITSVFPSTTVNALSSIWTGHAPGQHGLVGLRLLDPDFNSVNMMINLHPLYLRQRDAMVQAGFEPEKYLAAPGIAEQFAAAGVPTIDMKGREIIDSALSRMHGRGVEEKIGVISFPEMMWQIKDQLEKRSGPLVTIAYWPNIDTLSHIHGPDHPAVKLEMLSCWREIQQTLLDGLSPAARKGTVVLLAADHGQVRLSREKHIRLTDFPEIHQRLIINGAGGNRIPYWYIQQGEAEAVAELVKSQLGDRVKAMTRQEMMESGWYGEPPFMDMFSKRIGDLNLLMEDGGLMIDPSDANVDKFLRAGSHGGLSPDEMQVPFWGFRLD